MRLAMMFALFVSALPAAEWGRFSPASRPRQWNPATVFRSLLAPFFTAGTCNGSFTFTGGVCVATVGQTSRNYTTIALAVAGLPSNLVTDDNSYVIHVYKDGTGTNGEYTCTGTCFTIPALTTDATHTLTITAAPGESFMDNANVRTNALRYNNANGVAIRKTDDFGSLFTNSGAVDYLTISRLQLNKSATSSGGVIVNNQAFTSHGIYRDLLIEHSGNSGNVITAAGAAGSAPQWINVLIIQKSNSAVTCFDAAGGNQQLIGVGCAKTGTAGGTAFNRTAGTPTLKDSYAFGFTTASNGTWGTSSNNATDQTSITGTSNQTSVSYSTSTFTNITAGTHDYRVVSGAALIANGVLDATNAPNDISGAVRPSGPTIGPWEQNPVTGTAVRRRVIIQ